MKINSDNYEAYFLDYHEGRLDPVMAAEVLLFVGQHPELRGVFEGFEAFTLHPDHEVRFDEKTALKKFDAAGLPPVSEENYTEYLLAETEGLLDGAALAALDQFATAHPAIGRERRLFALAHLEADSSIVFADKDSLKHKAIPFGEINDTNFEMYLARELEGDLSAEENRMLGSFLAINPQLQRDREIYRATVLTPDAGIVFEGKSQLKHTVVPMRRIVYYALSAAASVAILLGIYFSFNTNVPAPQTAQRTEQQTVPEKGIPSNKNIAEPGKSVNLSPATAGNSSPEKEPALQLPDVTTTLPAAEDIALNTATPALQRTAGAPLLPLAAREARQVVSKQYVDPQFAVIRQSEMYLNTNRELYYNLKLAEELQYAALNAKDQKPGLKLWNALTGKVEDTFADNRKAAERPERPAVSVWTVAEFGVQTFNTITSGDLELNLTRDDEGKVVAYGLDTQLFGFGKEVKQREVPEKK